MVQRLDNLYVVHHADFAETNHHGIRIIDEKSKKQLRGVASLFKDLDYSLDTIIYSPRHHTIGSALFLAGLLGGDVELKMEPKLDYQKFDDMDKDAEHTWYKEANYYFEKDQNSLNSKIKNAAIITHFSEVAKYVEIFKEKFPDFSFDDKYDMRARLPKMYHINFAQKSIERLPKIK